MTLTRHGVTTVLAGRVRDQAELHGIMQRISDLGLTLLSATAVDHRPEGGDQECRFRVPNDGIREHAERLVDGSVGRQALAMAFSESAASSAEVLVRSRAFYPRMLEDIVAATSSVHVNQFGFRPGLVGEPFADALVAKAEQGVSVRLVVDRQGSSTRSGALDRSTIG